MRTDWWNPGLGSSEVNNSNPKPLGYTDPNGTRLRCGYPYKENIQIFTNDVDPPPMGDVNRLDLKGGLLNFLLKYEK